MIVDSCPTGDGRWGIALTWTDDHRTFSEWFAERSCTRGMKLCPTTWSTMHKRWHWWPNTTKWPARWRVHYQIPLLISEHHANRQAIPLRFRAKKWIEKNEKVVNRNSFICLVSQSSLHQQPILYYQLISIWCEFSIGALWAAFIRDYAAFGYSTFAIQ